MGAPASPAKTKAEDENEKRANSNQTQMEVAGWGLVRKPASLITGTVTEFMQYVEST